MMKPRHPAIASWSPVHPQRSVQNQNGPSREHIRSSSKKVRFDDQMTAFHLSPSHTNKYTHSYDATTSSSSFSSSSLYYCSPSSCPYPCHAKSTHRDANNSSPTARSKERAKNDGTNQSFRGSPYQIKSNSDLMMGMGAEEEVTEPGMIQGEEESEAPWVAENPGADLWQTKAGRKLLRRRSRPDMKKFWKEVRVGARAENLTASWLFVAIVETKRVEVTSDGASGNGTVNGEETN